MFSKLDCQFLEKAPTSYCTKRKKFEIITSIEEKPLVIVIACLSTARIYVPPMIIFRTVNFSNFYTRESQREVLKVYYRGKERTNSSRRFLVYLLIRFARISYGWFIAMSYKSELSTYVKNRW
jgi:hypothetical protein